MKGIYIYPHDVGAFDEYTEEWVAFIKKFGYVDGTPWSFVLVVHIDTN